MQPHADVKGAVILITGASGGLGSALAERLAAGGARLVLAGRRRDALERLAARLECSEPPRIVLGDLSRPGASETVFREAVAAWGRIDVLVNNAGAGYFALGTETSSDVTRHVFELNTLAPWDLARMAAAAMVERRRGTIVNIVSCSGRVPVPTTSVYGGSKSALAVMANTLRLEVEPSGVRVLNVYPGTVDTGFESNAFRESDRPGVCVSGHCGRPVGPVADAIVGAIAAGRSGELWMSRRGRLLAVGDLLWPRLVDRSLRRLRDWALARPTAFRPADERRWRLWQVETSRACNLGCVMCPWTDTRNGDDARGLMPQEVWDAIRPHLGDVASVDFTGGGEPLLNPSLFAWIADAHRSGCQTGFLTNGMRLDASACAEARESGVDWVAVSIDGATADVYHRFRPGARFDAVCANVQRLASGRSGGRPRIMVNFVMMPDNVHQIEDMVRLVTGLGAGVLNLKQADVVRGDRGTGFAVFGGRESESVERLRRQVGRATRLGRRLGVEVRAARFTPEEAPVCEQDPRDSLFVRFDGTLSPCINLAIGGPTTFLGREVVMPAVHYGRLPADDPREVWEREPCAAIRAAFAERERVFGEHLAGADISTSMLSLQEALAAARKAMPAAPDGCRHCHYLFGL
jgi:short-subunit dehydrogenase/MoaA/NifB/PqqE/SkfB family radical SAM enzyme